MQNALKLCPWLLPILAGCAPTAAKTDAQTITFARAMCEAAYSVGAYQTALEDPDNISHLGQRPCSSQLDFHLAVSATHSNNFALKLAAPLPGGVTAGAEGGTTNSHSQTVDDHITVQVENPVCSVKEYLAALTKDAKGKSVSTKDILDLYKKFDSIDKEKDRHHSVDYGQTPESIRKVAELAAQKCAAYDLPTN